MFAFRWITRLSDYTVEKFEEIMDGLTIKWQSATGTEILKHFCYQITIKEIPNIHLKGSVDKTMGESNGDGISELGKFKPCQSMGRIYMLYQHGTTNCRLV